jgi:hypothetical protein
MRLQLTPHPEFPSAAISAIACEATMASEALTLRYVAEGRIAELAIPRKATPARADELWRHTCFEAFVSADNGAGYFEFNFAPSTEWAAYRFERYREAMAPAEIEAPRISVTADTEWLEVTVALSRRALPPGPCRLALSAVIEDRAGARSYWALAHPPGRPDFHHEAGFASQLPAMEVP